MKRYKGQGGIGGESPGPAEMSDVAPARACCMLSHAHYMQPSQVRYYRFFRCINLLTISSGAMYNLVKIKRSDSKTPRRRSRATGASHHQQPHRIGAYAYLIIPPPQLSRVIFEGGQHEPKILHPPRLYRLSCPVYLGTSPGLAVADLGNRRNYDTVQH